MRCRWLQENRCQGVRAMQIGVLLQQEVSEATLEERSPGAMQNERCDCEKWLSAQWDCHFVLCQFTSEHVCPVCLWVCACWPLRSEVSTQQTNSSIEREIYNARQCRSFLLSFFPRNDTVRYSWEKSLVVTFCWSPRLTEKSVRAVHFPRLRFMSHTVHRQAQGSSFLAQLFKMFYCFVFVVILSTR